PANLDLAVAHASLEAGLVGRRGALEHASVREREARSVPRADDAVALELALGERAAEMRASFAERVDAAIVAHEDDRHSFGDDAFRLAFAELGIVEDRNERSRPLAMVGAIDSDAAAIDEVSAEVGACDRQRDSRASRRPGALLHAWLPHRERRAKRR